MIYYFSGEGNTAYAAHIISKNIGEDRHYIPDTNPVFEKMDGLSLGFMFPIYSWGVPPIVRDFIAGLSETFIHEVKKNRIPVWMVVTCGDDIGDTTEMMAEILENRGLKLSAAWSIIMPNTYVLLPGFNVDKESLEARKLDKSIPRLREISGKIKEGIWEVDVKRGSFPWLKTKICYPLFVKFAMKPSKWHWNAECIGCGRCARQCPVDNIEMKGGHPRWGINCVGCLGCYHICPVHAVGYGNRTSNKGQYICPLR